MVGPELDGDGLVAQLGHGLLAEVVQAHVQRHEDVLFAGEVVVEGGLGDAQALGDLPQAGAVVALVGEEVERHIENAFAGRGGVVVEGVLLGLGGLGELGVGEAASGVVVAAIDDRLVRHVDLGIRAIPGAGVGGLGHVPRHFFRDFFVSLLDDR